MRREALDAKDLINFLKGMNCKQADRITGLLKENKGLKARLRRYEGEHMPGDTLYNAERKAWREKNVGSEKGKGGANPGKGKQGGAPVLGPPKGHLGVSHNHKSNAEPVRHPLPNCPHCSGKNPRKMRPKVKVVVDFAGSTMVLESRYHIRERAVCRDCRLLVEAPWPVVPGTMLGEKALGFIAEYAGRKNTDEDIAGYFANLYGFYVASTTIWNARRALARLLGATYGHIMEELKRARFIQMDESPFRINGIRGQMWLARTDTATFMVVTDNRRGETLDRYFDGLFLIPVVVDGYAAYPGRFVIIQWCWAHILREAEKAAASGGEHCMEELLHKALLGIFHEAKQAAARTADSGGADAEACIGLKNRVLAIADAYGNHPFAGTLRNAAPNLFTFLRYPGMPPTNNATEGDIRDGVVLERNIRKKLVTAEGMRVFSVLHSFTQTCRKLDLVPWKQTVHIVRDPDWNIFDEARRQNPGLLDDFRASLGWRRSCPPRDPSRRRRSCPPCTGPRSCPPCTGPRSCPPCTGPRSCPPCTGPRSCPPCTGPRSCPPCTGPR